MIVYAVFHENCGSLEGIFVSETRARDAFPTEKYCIEPVELEGATSESCPNCGCFNQQHCYACGKFW